MNVILAIVRSDFAQMRRNALTVVVIAGLVLVPALYAWLNTWGFWDPYAHTGNVKIAVANKDDGFENAEAGLSVHAGAQVITALRANESFDWEFVGADEALGELEQGRYYAAIVIPADFSANLMSAFRPSHEQARILYYVNQKENAIAPHLTQEGANALLDHVDAAFAEAVGDAVADAAGLAASSANQQTVEAFAQTLVSELNDITNQLKAAEGLARAYAQLAQATNALSEPVDQSISAGQELSAKVDGLSEEAWQAVEDAQGILEPLTNLADSNELTQAVRKAALRLQALAGGGEDLANSVDGGLGAAAEGGRAFATSMEDAHNALTSSADLLAETANDLTSTRNELQAAIDSQDLARVRAIIGDDPAAFIASIAQPVELVRHAVFPMASNGDAMSAFYTSLSIWIGAVFLVALLRVEVPPATRAALGNPAPRLLYLGRGTTFALISLVQATLVCVGNLLILGVQCVHPALYFTAAWTTSIAFSAIVFTLVASFGNIGKALAVLGMVMQVAGSGGIFPVQMSADFFQMVYPWLPFTHSIEAFQGAIAGVWGNQFWESIAKLSAYLAPTLIVGLGLRRILARANARLDQALAQTKLML